MKVTPGRVDAKSDRVRAELDRVNDLAGHVHVKTDGVNDLAGHVHSESDGVNDPADYVAGQMRPRRPSTLLSTKTAFATPLRRDKQS